MCVVLAHSAVFFQNAFGKDIRFGSIIINAGYYGVVFFYVLSGFLITYLLETEKINTGSIAVRNFYMRRVLRIWPLYYLIIVISFLLLYLWNSVFVLGGSSSSLLPMLLYFLFLPNIVPACGFYLATCFHTYTIGYEEQFYLIWPIVLKRIKYNLLSSLTVLFFLPLALELFHLYLNAHIPGRKGPFIFGIRAVLTFIDYSNMAAFIAGAIGALLFIRGKGKLLRMTGMQAFPYFLMALLLWLMYAGNPKLPGYVNIVSLLFTLLILTCVQSTFPVNRIGRLLALGGKISYGIYIYHPLVLILVSLGLKSANLSLPGSPLFTYLLYVGLSIAVVLLIASCSYKFFEQPFLRMKTGFKAGALSRT